MRFAAQFCAVHEPGTDTVDADVVGYQHSGEKRRIWEKKCWKLTWKERQRRGNWLVCWMRRPVLSCSRTSSRPEFFALGEWLQPEINEFLDFLEYRKNKFNTNFEKILIFKKGKNKYSYWWKNTYITIKATGNNDDSWLEIGSIGIQKKRKKTSDDDVVAEDVRGEVHFDSVDGELKNKKVIAFSEIFELSNFWIFNIMKIIPALIRNHVSSFSNNKNYNFPEQRFLNSIFF